MVVLRLQPFFCPCSLYFNLTLKKTWLLKGICKHLWYWVLSVQFSSVQSLSHVQLFVTPWTALCQASLSITISWSLLKLISIKSVMPTSSDKLISLKHYLLNCTLSESAVNYSIGNESCSHGQSLWSGSFHKPLILLHQRVDRMKNTATEN